MMVSFLPQQSEQGVIMDKIDLIIDALESAHHTNDTGVMGLTKSRLDVALAAARELRAMKPEGISPINGVSLYALDEVKHD